jgi:hypothetical protein
VEDIQLLTDFKAEIQINSKNSPLSATVVYIDVHTIDQIGLVTHPSQVHNGGC